VGRKFPVRTAAPNAIFVISSERELSLSEANRITQVFLHTLKDEYGENVLPSKSPLAFHFEISTDADGRITSQLPTLDKIHKSTGHWLDEF
jgi:hypothetical protein